MSGSGFADGIEFEETFPEPLAVDAAPASATSAAAPAAAPVATSAPLAAPRVAAPAAPRVASPAAPRLTVVPNAARQEMSEALFEEQLDRRLREAEAMVKETIERMRIDEEQRLTDWVQERRAEEERRLAKWADERRASVERSMEQRTTHADDLSERIQSMLVEWQDRFEHRLEQRRIDEERLAERRRISDEERLRAWRAELEQALTERFSERRAVDRAPLPDRSGEVRATLRDAVASATNARDVGRILRDVLSELAHTAAFALALHHAGRDEVAYRYRVAADDELGTSLRRDALDDAPESAVAHMDGWARAHRTVRVGARNATVHTAQLALRVADTTVGVLTLQSEGEAIADNVLSRVTDLAALAAPRLAELRDRGSFRGA